MRKKLFIALVLLLHCNLMHAQFTNSNWCFGDSAGIKFSPNISTFKCGTGFMRGTASISDSNGHLIFYGSTSNTTNGFTGQIEEGKLFNKLHFKLFNGDTLVGGNWYHDMLILPKSILDSTFYVFVAGVVWPDTGLWYNIIDMKLQGGLGQVVQKNVRYTLDPVQDMLTAVKHGNGRDWWLVTRRWSLGNGTFPASDEFLIYLIDSVGIHPLPIQQVGLPHFDNGGDLSFNISGNKLALCGLGNYLGIFDFDRCTGTVSNEILIEPNGTQHPFRWYSSVVFSPDGSKLYVNSSQEAYSQSGKLYQFDLNSSNIPASRFLIDSFPVDAENFGMERGIDGKIYISSIDRGGCNYPWPSGCFTPINSNLSVINYPDSLGATCDFQLLSFSLGGYRTYWGLPNNPDYELGAWVGSPCDTLSVGIGENGIKEEVFFQAWYNHEWDMIHFNAAKLEGNKALLRLYDVQGRLVYERKMEVIPGGYVTGEIPMGAVADGVYVVSLVTELESISSKAAKF